MCQEKGLSLRLGGDLPCQRGGQVSRHLQIIGESAFTDTQICVHRKPDGGFTKIGVTGIHDGCPVRGGDSIADTAFNVLQGNSADVNRTDLQVIRPLAAHLNDIQDPLAAVMLSLLCLRLSGGYLLAKRNEASSPVWSG